MEHEEPAEPLERTDGERRAGTSGRILAGRFALVEPLGKGSFGEVWRGRDDKLQGRPVAIKVQRPRRSAALRPERHFQREMKALRKLRHPGIVQVIHAEEHEGLAFLVTDLADGRPLHEWVDSHGQRPISLDLIAAVFGQVLLAISHAHEHGVSHLDLKPAHILVAGTLESPVVRVVDFGLARVSDASTSTGGSSGVGAGTLLYMAPEQQGMVKAKIGPRSDVFALAAILVEMLTGSSVAASGQPWWDRRTGDREDLESSFLVRRPDVPPVVWKVIVKALDPDPKLRYASASDFRLALRDTWPLDKGKKNARFGPPSRIWVLLFVFILLFGSVGLNLTISGGLHPECVPFAVRTALTPAPLVEPVEIVLPVRPTVIPIVECRNGHDCTVMGLAHEYGRGVVHDFIEAAGYYQRGCDLGEGTGCYRLALLFDKGLGVLPDWRQKQVLFERACNLGYIRACVAAVDSRISVDPAEKVAFYEHACSVGERLGCWRRANLLWYGEGSVVRDRDLARKVAASVPELYQRDCDAGDIIACLTLGRAYCSHCGEGAMDDAGHISWLLDPDDVRSTALFSHACDQSDLEACTSLGESYGRGRGVVRNRARAFGLFEVSCRFGVMSACMSLARMYRQGEGVTRNLRQHALLVARACAGGDLNGCVSAGWALLDGSGVPKNPELAAELYIYACERGSDLGCAHIAALLLEGTDFPKDPLTALDWYQRACERGYGRSCSTLALLHARGEVVPRDTRRAMVLWWEQCHAGDWDACSEIGRTYKRGDGVPSDIPRAVAMLTSVCTEQITDGCTDLGAMFQHGAGIPRDLASAKRFLQRACDGDCDDDGMACFDLALMYESGDGVLKDPAQAQALFEKGCQLGEGRACAARRPPDPCQSTGILSL